MTMPIVQGGSAMPVFAVNDSTSPLITKSSGYPPLRSIKAKTLAVTNAVPISSFNFTPGELSAATAMLICTFTNGANFLCDGSTPTTTFGIPLQAGVTVIFFDGNTEINALQVVSQSGTANVTIVLYQYLSV